MLHLPHQELLSGPRIPSRIWLFLFLQCALSSGQSPTKPCDVVFSALCYPRIICTHIHTQVLLRLQDKASLQQLLVAVDKANGYCFATLRGHMPYSPEMLYGSSGADIADKDIWLGLQEKYIDGEVQEVVAGSECTDEGDDKPEEDSETGGPSNT